MNHHDPDPRELRERDPRELRDRRPRALDTADIASAGERREQERRAGDLSAMPHPAADVAHALFPENELSELRHRWSEIQAAFVDDPRRTVQEADHLVADAFQRLATTFADQRQTLESQWSRDREVSTEDLRLALQRYRSFFDRVLHV